MLNKVAKEKPRQEIPLSFHNFPSHTLNLIKLSLTKLNSLSVSFSRTSKKKPLVAYAPVGTGYKKQD